MHDCTLSWLTDLHNKYVTVSVYALQLNSRWIACGQALGTMLWGCGACSPWGSWGTHKHCECHQGEAIVLLATTV